MPELHVRNIPADVHERLRKHAREQGRSMSADVVMLLRQALAPAVNSQAQDAVERLAHLRSRRRLPADVPVAEQLVRQDRDSRP